MSWVLSFLGGPVISKLLSLIPDPNARAEQQFELQKAMLDAAAANDAAQIGANTAQASSGSLFIAGARPAAMWVCVIGFAYQSLFLPVTAWAFWLAGHPIDPSTLPPIDQNTLTDMLYALLGLGTMRTADKIGGVDTKAVSFFARIAAKATSIL